MAPQPAHAGEVVFELCQLDLQLALGAVGVRGEYVQDHRGAVDHRQAQRLLEVALLPGAQLVVAGDQVGVAGARHGADLGHLAGAEVGVGMRSLATLNELAHDAHAGGAHELFELPQVLSVGHARHAQRPLARALSRGRAITGPHAARGRGVAAVAASLHPPLSLGPAGRL